MHRVSSNHLAIVTIGLLVLWHTLQLNFKLPVVNHKKPFWLPDIFSFVENLVCPSCPSQLLSLEPFLLAVSMILDQLIVAIKRLHPLSSGKLRTIERWPNANHKGYDFSFNSTCIHTNRGDIILAALLLCRPENNSTWFRICFWIWCWTWTWTTWVKQMQWD